MSPIFGITDPMRDLNVLYRRLAKARRIHDQVAVITLSNEIARLETFLRFET